MFASSFLLLKLFGIEIRINPGWAVIATLVAWSLAQGTFPELYAGLDTQSYWAMALAAVVGLGVSIIIHELAHSLVAARFGTPVSSITLFMFGGVAALEQEPRAPIPELLMALAGPAMSLVLSGLFFGASIAVGGIDQLPVLAGVLHYLALLNLVLAIFNLVPAFPMDGGRALRATIWAATGDIRKATMRASQVGKYIGTGFMLAGLLAVLTGNLLAGIWWVLIGGFIRASAIGAFLNARIETVLDGLPVARFMTLAPDTVSSDLTLADFVENHLYKFGHDMFPVLTAGKPVGTIGLGEVRLIPPDAWPKTLTGNVMTPLTPLRIISADEPAMNALIQMQKNGLNRLLVTDHETLLGVIVLKDLMDLLSMKLALEPAGGRA
jgi:Zn-dependent protease